MSSIRLPLALLALTLPSACATPPVPSDSVYVPYRRIADLVNHPRRWDGRIVTLRVFPYDNGFAGSYRLCFEPCGPAAAGRSGAVVYTRANRFRGYRGDRPVVITARYSSACLYDPNALCPDLPGARFTEIEAP